MTNMLDLHVEYLSVDHLIPYTHNARMHSDDQVAQIAGSMTEFGFVNPIPIGDDGGIIIGHGRVMAARMLGVKEVPVIRLKHLNDVQRRALIIADNKITEKAGWDENLLRQEFVREQLLWQDRHLPQSSPAFQCGDTRPPVNYRACIRSDW